MNDEHIQKISKDLTKLQNYLLNDLDESAPTFKSFRSVVASHIETENKLNNLTELFIETLNGIADTYPVFCNQQKEKLRKIMDGE